MFRGLLTGVFVDVFDGCTAVLRAGYPLDFRRF